MAEIHTTTRDYDKAIKSYKEGLAYDDTHIPVSTGVRIIATLSVHACDLSPPLFSDLFCCFLLTRSSLFC